MIKDNVIKVRDAFKNAGVKIQVFGDNSNVYDERYDVLIWDDSKELLYVIQRVKTQSVYEYSDPKNVAYYSILEYDIIQYIQAVSDFNQFKELLPQFGSETSERQTAIINWVGELIDKRINVKPGTDTKLDLALKDPAKFDSVFGRGEAAKYVKEHGVEIPNVVYTLSSGKTLQDVFNEVNRLQEVELGEETNISESITIPKNRSVTLNLSGNILNVDKETPIVVNGELIIKDITGTGKITSEKSPIVAEGPNAKVIIDSGVIESTNDYAIYARDGGTIVVNDGEIVSKNAPFTGNNTTGNMNFEINGGTFTAEDGPAVYMPGQGKLKITGGTFNGGISLRMGQVDISGGTFNAITKNIDDPKEYYHYSGNAWFPDTLYVIGGTYDSSDDEYRNSLKLNITGGTFNCQNDQGGAIAIYDIGKTYQKMEVTISKKANINLKNTDNKAIGVLSLANIGVTNPKLGYNISAYTGKVSLKLVD